MSPLKLKTAVQEGVRQRHPPWQKVQFAVEAFPDATFDGEVACVALRSTRRRARSRGSPRTERRRPPQTGFFAKGTVSTHLDENVPAVSLDAVSTLAGVSSVYIIEDGKIRQQTVALGSQTESWSRSRKVSKGDEKLAASNLNQLARNAGHDWKGRMRTAAGAASVAAVVAVRPGAGAPKERQCGFAEGRSTDRGDRRPSMKLADVSVRRPVFALMMTAALIVLGAFCANGDLSLDLMRRPTCPVVTVQVALPGASAEEVETTDHQTC